MTRIAVVKTRTANTASVLAALRRLGAEVVLTHDPEAIERADGVVLPGVGAFAAAMGAIEPALAQALRDRIGADRATLGICLGLQVLGSESEESPGVPGLGVFDVPVVRLPDSVRVPHLGWNRVQPTPGCELLTEGYAAFANSYHLARLPEGWQGATADHGGPFVAAVERGRVLACQFHPEISGAWGRDLLQRWLEVTC